MTLQVVSIYSFHPGGALFGFGDGSVDLVSSTIDIDVFITKFTREARDIDGIESLAIL